MKDERIGQIQMAQGNLAGALQSYTDSLAIAHHLADADPSNGSWQHDLAVAYGEVADDISHEANSRTRSRPIATRSPSPIGWLRHIRTTTNGRKAWRSPTAKSGSNSRTRVKLPAALTFYQNALPILERLTAADRNNGKWQFNLGVLHGKIGTIQKVRGDFAAALKSYEARRDIDQRMAAVDFSSIRWQRDLSTSLIDVGSTQVAQGDYRGGLASFHGAQTILDNSGKPIPAIPTGRMLWRFRATSSAMHK